MFGLSARSRIAIGQSILLLSVLLVAFAIGIMPDHRVAVMAGRAALCEAVAANSSAMVGQNDVKRMESVLRLIVERNPDVLSAAVRRRDGKMLVEIGDHRTNWQESVGPSSDSQVQVPIRAGDAVWGTVQMRFQPVTWPGLLGFLHNPRTRMAAFVTASTLLLYLFYLGKMLEHFDPSKVVPNRVRNALNTFGEGLLVIDRQERIVLANQAFANLVGRPPEQLVGRRASQFEWVRNGHGGNNGNGASKCDAGHEGLGGAGKRGDHNGHGAGDYPWMRAIAEESAQANVEMRLRDFKGDERTFMVNCSPVLGHDGNYRGVLATFEDVTQLEQTKVELAKSKDAAESANRAKSEFLARMSHEIRTPMNAILGFTEVLRRGFEGSDEERRDYLNTIHSSGQHLLDLINDILDLSKVEAGKLEIERVPCSPVQIVCDVVSILGVRARQKGITLESEISGQVPEAIVSDPVRLRQILMNLVGNAIKFTESGGVKIAARFLPGDSPRMAFDVIDTGIGIAADAMAKIFEPFAQADTSITRRFGGTGLGLAICRRFADALGGELTVESVVGSGSAFTLTLGTGPLDGVRLLDARAAVAAAKQKASGAAAELKLPPARILVVDDGAENRKLVELVLRRAGAEVESAANGAIGVELATRPGARAFDVILMDVQMPVMDGFTATATLRQRGVTVPIFALSAHAMKGEDEKCKEAGFTGFLPKPINLDQLIKTVAEQLGGSNCRSQIADCRLASEQTSTPCNESTGHAADPSAICNSPSAIETEPLVSSLPTDDSEFLEIVVEFVERLHERLAAMDDACAKKNFVELQRLAHWLKGSGGTAGFAAFTEPSRTLERLVKEHQSDQSGDEAQRRSVRIEAALADLHGLAARIVIAREALATSA